MSYTPGPWKAMIRPDHGVVVVKGPNGVIIAQRALTQEQKRNDELYANAQLIAAAPELYEALENLMDFLFHGKKDRQMILRASAALAKARGEEEEEDA